MKFTVKFEASYLATNLDADTIGLSQLDELAEIPEASDAQLKDVRSPRRPFTRRLVYAYPDRDMARRSGHFGDRSTVTVRVPDRSLERFVTYHWKKSFGTWTYVPRENGNDILEAWAASGFPLEWDPDQEPEPEPQFELWDTVAMEAKYRVFVYEIVNTYRLDGETIYELATPNDTSNRSFRSEQQLVEQGYKKIERC